ncbi:MAG: IS1380 family transposase [Planctomycetaceae bacterium]|nr:MAG: IS1380 family transposase [Planctomycetaceae bacterium]
MKISLQRKLSRRERQVRRRIDKANWSGQSPMFAPPALQYELADRAQAMCAGGLGVIQELVKQLDLAEIINRGCPIFQLRLPYSEADHVLNIAYNLLAGGTCLEHLELRRLDEAYLNALGAERIPDPTTAGDFCRRFDPWNVFALQESFHEARLKVWQQQPDSFFDLAVIEADGTMVETRGERKEGIGMDYKQQWGYHSLVMTLAQTREVLYVVNRSGNRPSHEGAPGYFDRAIDVCRSAGFRRLRLRGDTDFSQTQHLDRWHDAGVEFVFGMDAMPNLVTIAENLPASAWHVLPRKQRTSDKPRARRPNAKEQVVIDKEYTNKRLEKEFVAEFEYSPTACRQTYRIVVLRKQVSVTKGQQKLFDDSPYFFYLTNITAQELTTAEIVGQSNQRCDQENILSQLKQMGALSAPLHTLTSNGAYMAMATLAWNLKCWLALSLPESGPPPAKEKRRAEKQRLVRMDFSTFRQSLIMIPTQIIRTSRRLIYRLLAWTPSLTTLFRLHESVSQPMRC